MLPVILAAFIVGLLGVGLSSLYSGAFSTLSAEKEAREAQDILDMEKEIVKAFGFDGYEDGLDESKLTEDTWLSMKDILGEEKGRQWEYKLVTVPDTSGNLVRSVGASDNEAQLRIVKVSIRKNGDTISRASAEVPLSSQDSSSFPAPDFNKATDITGQHTVPYDGYLNIFCLSDEASDAATGVQFYINNLCVCFASSRGDEGIDTAYSFVPVKKGDTLSWSIRGYGYFSCQIIPIAKH